MKAPGSWPGTCANCKRRRDVYSISRSGGGTYRRGGRNYHTSICADCVLGLVPFIRFDTSTSRYSSNTLYRIALSLPAAWPAIEPLVIADNDRRERHAVRKILRENTVVL